MCTVRTVVIYVPLAANETLSPALHGYNTTSLTLNEKLQSWHTPQQVRNGSCNLRGAGVGGAYGSYDGSNRGSLYYRHPCSHQRGPRQHASDVQKHPHNPVSDRMISHTGRRTALSGKIFRDSHALAYLCKIFDLRLIGLIFTSITFLTKENEFSSLAEVN